MVWRTAKKITNTIGDTWVDLTSTLENSGFGEYFENIGVKLNPMLKMFETMFRLLEKINFMGMGGVFGFAANTLSDMQSKVDEKEKTKNPLFNPNSGAAGSWGEPKKIISPDKNKDIQSELLKLIPGGVLTLNINDPSGLVKDADSSKSFGVKVKTSSTIGITPYNEL